MNVRVGVIGLGVIGKPIAERLAKQGFRVCVYDVLEATMAAALRDADLIACGSCAEVAGSSEVVISLVRDGQETEELLFGKHRVLSALRPGTILLIGSTVSPELARRVAAAVKERGCEALDMPFTGGYQAALEGSLTLMVGGEADVLERAAPVLRAIGRVITHVGEVGAGQVAKLSHQLIMSMNIMALLEGLSLGAAGGIAPAVLKQIIQDGLAKSGVLEVWDYMGPRWKRFLESAPADAVIPIMKKDLHLALELAHELGVELPLGEHASRIADAGHATGCDDPRL